MYNIFDTIKSLATGTAGATLSDYMHPQEAQTMGVASPTSKLGASIGNVAGAISAGTPGASLYDATHQPVTLKNTTFTPQDEALVKDAMSKGVSKNDAFKLVLNFKAEQEQKTQKVQEMQGQRGNMFEKIGGGVQDIVGGVVSEVPKIAGNIATFGKKAMNYNPVNLALTGIEAATGDKTYSQLREEQNKSAEKYSQIGEQGKALIQKYGAYDPTSTASKVGEVGAGIGASLIGPNKLGILKEGTGLVKGVLPKVINSAIEGGLASAKYDVATKGKTTPDSLITGAEVGGTLGVIGSALGKGKEFFTKELPKQLETAGLINAGAIKKVANDLKGLGVQATEKDAGEWLLNRGIKGNPEQMAQQIGTHTENAQNAVKNMLAQNVDEAGKPIIYNNKVTNDLGEKLLEARGMLEKSPVGNEQAFKEIDPILNSLTQGKGMTAQQINEARNLLQDYFKIFRQDSIFSDVVSKQGTQNVWKNASSFLDKEMPGFRVLNKDVQVGKGIQQAILDKEQANAARSMLGLGGTIGAVGGGIEGARQGYQKGGVVGAIEGAGLGAVTGGISGAITRNVFENKGLQTNIANALYKAKTPETIKAIGKVVAPVAKQATIQETKKVKKSLKK